MWLQRAFRVSKGLVSKTKSAVELVESLFRVIYNVDSSTVNKLQKIRINLEACDENKKKIESIETKLNRFECNYRT